VYLTLRRFRHLAAVLLGVLLLQASLLGAGMACAVTTGAAPADAGGVASSHGMHGHHGPGAPDATDSRDQRGREHAQMHCPAAMTCATFGVAGVVTTLPAAVLVPPAQIAALDSAPPESVSGAPEPPPPRG